MTGPRSNNNRGILGTENRTGIKSRNEDGDLLSTNTIIQSLVLSLEAVSNLASFLRHPSLVKK